METKGRKPRYVQIHEELRSRILKGQYEFGDFLPAERALAESFSVERVTVRRALAILVDEGLIEKRAGSGSQIVFLPEKEAVAETPCPPIPVYKNVAFVVPGDSTVRISEPFMAALFNDVASECQKRGYNLFYTNANNSADLPDMIRQHNTDAVIWMSEVERGILEYAYANKIPSIVYGSRFDTFTCIELDHSTGSRLAVQHLIKAGHRRIAYINGIPHYLSSIERLKGYQKTLREAGLPLIQDYVGCGNWSYEGGIEAMNLLLELPEPPTAVFAANDMMAIGAAKAVRERGLSVPDDISIVGFDNLERAQQAVPPLTSVGCVTKIIAQVIGSYVKALIAGPANPAVRVILPVHLTVRDSVAPPRT